MKKLLYFFICISSLQTLYASNYYVSPSGNTDFHTIQDAINTATAGDTVYIKRVHTMNVSLLITQVL